MATEAEKKAYEDAHKFNDTNASERAIHHTLGTDSNQAMPGNIVQGMALSSTPTSAEIYAILQKLVG